MKPLLAAIAGFVGALAIFVSGGLVATWVLAAKPVAERGPGADAGSVWTEQPRRVDPSGQEMLRRVPARPPPVETLAGVPAKPDAPGSVSMETTASTQSGATIVEAPHADPELVAAHLNWCESRYRSYRPRDNSYTPYGGGRRPCVSPWWDALSGRAEPVSPPPAEGDGYAESTAEPTLDYASVEMDATSDHANYCFDRYRSYRPDDNTYQPYGGGPRRQCE